MAEGWRRRTTVTVTERSAVNRADVEPVQAGDGVVATC